MDLSQRMGSRGETTSLTKGEGVKGGLRGSKLGGVKGMGDHSMAVIRDSLVTDTSFCTSGATSPQKNVREQSPWCPSRKTVTSMLMMSPSTSARLSGIPWQMHSLTEVQTLLGKRP